MIPTVRPHGEPAPAGTQQPEPASHGVRLFLDRLFPESPQPAVRTAGFRALIALLQVAAVAVGTGVLLLRVPGRPWDTIYGEDYWEWGVQGIQQPWHLFITYSGYWQILPRLLTQLSLYLPLPDLSKGLAVSGALVASLCGLFAFHASAGHVRSTWLRALIGVSFVLLAIAPMEVADSAVNTIWYLTPALFWAILWRPRTFGGMAVAALVAFLAAADNIMVILFAPLLLARWYVLRRPRDQAVTVGWLLGCIAQVPFVVSSYLNGPNRLGEQKASLGLSNSWYGHDVVLPSLSWHLALWLSSALGRNGATALMAVVLILIFGVILIIQPATRPFVLLALVTGYVFTVFGITLTARIALVPTTPVNEWGARYTVLPILLMEAAVIVAVDYALRQRAGHRRRATLERAGGLPVRPALAVTALVAVLAFGWIVDFRYVGIRTQKSWDWPQIAAKWESDCAHSRTGEITERTAATINTLPCSNIHP